VAGSTGLRTALSAGVTLLTLTCVVAACGGSTRPDYTYNFAPKSDNAASKGVFLRVESPVRIPASAFKGGRLVDHVSGPEACSFKQTITKPPKRYASLAGTTVTFKVYGKGVIASLICGVVKSAGTGGGSIQFLPK
jgi:hypothetical protein